MCLDHWQVFGVKLAFAFFRRYTLGCEAVNGLADAFDAFLDVALFEGGEAEAEVLLATAIDVKWLADDEGNVVAGALTQQRAGAHVAGQATPEVEAACRVINAHGGGPVLADGMQHKVALLLVTLSHLCEMFV